MKRFWIAAVAALALGAPLAQAAGGGHGGRDRGHGRSQAQPRHVDRGHSRGYVQPRHVDRGHGRGHVVASPRFSIRTPRVSVVIGGGHH